MAEVLSADHPDASITRIPTSRLQNLSSKRGYYGVNQNGVAENGHCPKASSTALSDNSCSTDKRRLTPRNKYKQTSEKPVETSSAKSFLRRFVFRRSTREKKKGKVDTETENSQSNARSLPNGERVTTSGYGTTGSFVDKRYLHGATYHNQHTDTTRTELELRNPSGLLRSASFSDNTTKSNYFQSFALKRSASVSLTSRPTGYNTRYKPKQSSITELEELTKVDGDDYSDNQYSNAMAGYSPKLLGNGSVNTVGKSSHKRMNEQICLNDMKKSSSTTTLCSDTKETKSSQVNVISPEVSCYSPSSQVYIQRHLKEDTSLGSVVKLASKTKTKNKGSKPISSTNKAKQRSLKGDYSYYNHGVVPEESGGDEIKTHNNSDRKDRRVNRNKKGAVVLQSDSSNCNVQNAFSCPSDITNTIDAGRPKSAVFTARYSKSMSSSAKSGTNRPHSMPPSTMSRPMKQDLPSNMPTVPDEREFESAIMSYRGEHSRTLRSQLANQQSGSFSPDTVIVMSGKEGGELRQGHDLGKLTSIPTGAYKGEHSRTLRSTMERRRELSNLNSKETPSGLGHSVIRQSQSNSLAEEVFSTNKQTCDNNVKSTSRVSGREQRKESQIPTSSANPQTLKAPTTSIPVKREAKKSMSGHLKKNDSSPQRMTNKALDSNGGLGYSGVQVNVLPANQQKNSPSRQTVDISKCDIKKASVQKDVPNTKTSSLSNPMQGNSGPGKANSGIPTFQRQNSFREKESDKKRENDMTKKNEEVMKKTGKFEKQKSMRQLQSKMPRPKSDSFGKVDTVVKRSSSVRRSLGEMDYKQLKKSSFEVKGQAVQSSMSRSGSNKSQTETQVNDEAAQSVSHSRLPKPKLKTSPKKSLPIDASPEKSAVEKDRHLNLQETKTTSDLHRIDSTHERSPSTNKKSRKGRHISDNTECKVTALQQDGKANTALLKAEISINRLGQVEKKGNNEEGVRNIDKRASANSDRSDLTCPSGLESSEWVINTGMSELWNCKASDDRKADQMVDIVSQASSVGVTLQKGSGQEIGRHDNLNDKVCSTSVKKAVPEREVNIQRNNTKPAVHCRCDNDRITYSNSSTNSFCQQQNTNANKKTSVPKADSAEHLRARQSVDSLGKSLKLTDSNKEGTHYDSDDTGKSTGLQGMVMNESSVNQDSDGFKPLERAKSISLNDILDDSVLSSSYTSDDFCSALESMDNMSLDFDAMGPRGEKTTAEMTTTEADEQSIESQNNIQQARTLETESTLQNLESASNAKNNVKTPMLSNMKEENLKSEIATATDYTKSGAELTASGMTLSSNSNTEFTICQKDNMKSSKITKEEYSSREGAYPAIHSDLCLAEYEERKEPLQRKSVTDSPNSDDASNTSKVGNGKELKERRVLSHEVGDKVIVKNNSHKKNDVKNVSESISRPDEERKLSPGTFRTIISISPKSKSEIPTPIRKHSKSISRSCINSVSPDVCQVGVVDQSDAHPPTSRNKSPIRKSSIPRHATSKHGSQNSPDDGSVCITHVNQSKELNTHKPKTDRQAVGLVVGANMQTVISINKDDGSTLSPQSQTSETKPEVTAVKLSDPCDDEQSSLKRNVDESLRQNVVITSVCQLDSKEGVTRSGQQYNQAQGCTQESPIGAKSTSKQSSNTQQPETCTSQQEIIELTSPRKRRSNFPLTSAPGRSISSPALSSTPEVKSRFTSHLSTQSLAKADLRLKRSRAMSCLHKDRLNSDVSWSEERKINQSNDTLDELSEFNDSTNKLFDLAPSEFYSETEVVEMMSCQVDSDQSLNIIGDDDFTDNEKKGTKDGNTEKTLTVRFASNPIVRIYSDRGKHWIESEDSKDVSDYDYDDDDSDSFRDIDSYIEEMDESGCNEGRYVPLCNVLDFDIHNSKIQSGENEGRMKETVGSSTLDNGERMVAHTQEGDDSTFYDSARGVPYVTCNMGDQSDKYSQEIEKQPTGLDMLNTDKSYCVVTENNRTTHNRHPGVTTDTHKRIGRDSRTVIRVDTGRDRPTPNIEAAMCVETPSPKRSEVNLREKGSVIDPQKFSPQLGTTKQAWTWTNIDLGNHSRNNHSNRGKVSGDVKEQIRPVSANEDLIQVEVNEQSKDLLKPCHDTGSFVTETGERTQKSDPANVNGLYSAGITEPCPSADWHSSSGECAKQTYKPPQRSGRDGSSQQLSTQLHTQNATKAADNPRRGKNLSPRTNESLSSRLRKKSMLLAYDEGQLQIADDTTYRSLDIETDFDLITQLSDPVEEYVSELQTSVLKSPEQNNNMSIKGSATSTPKPQKTKKYSPPSTGGSSGSSKRNSITSIPIRKTSGVSVASLDLEGKEQKGNWPKDKLQKLKKHISEGILGSTKHKEGRKSSTDIHSFRDQSFFGDDASSTVHRHTGIDKVARKDSGADVSAKVEDTDRTQTGTPKLERRPSRRQRKLAISPVENERIFTQFHKERTNSWSGSDDSGIHNNQSRSSTDVSITEDDVTKETNAIPGEIEAPVVRRRRPRPLQRRPKSDITDHRWEEYASAMGAPPTPPPRTITRRPISDPLVTDDNELGEVVYREKKNSQPRPKSDHYGDYKSVSDEVPRSPVTPRYRPGSLAVIRDYGGEDNIGSGSSTPTTEIPTVSLQNVQSESKGEKVPAGSKLRRSRRPRPMSDLGHIDMQDIDKFVQQQQQRRYSGQSQNDIQSVVGQQAAAVIATSQEYMHRSVSTPTDLDDLMSSRILSTGSHLTDEDSSSGEDITSPAYGSSDVQSRYATYARHYNREEDYDDTLTYAEALWDHVTMDEDEVAFKAGDVIEVTDMMDKDWWWGRIQDREGWFPASFVRLRVNQSDTVEECVAKIKDGTLSLTSQKMKKLSISFLSKDQVRSNVINEIISTEKVYVKHLRDVCEGYVRQCHKRPEMFSPEITAKIFGNIEEIYLFQNKFVKKLQSCINHGIPHLSEIGHCFLDNRQEFCIYSTYCNNHPSAMLVLKELYENRKYRHFFEACRLLQEMIEISLDGFLLTPVQKICKYPLQLAELLKYTKPEHKDYAPLKAALEEMKNVASLINEQKRRLESVHTIAKWQLSIEGWEGDDLLEHSSILIQSGEVTKISKGLGRAKVRQVFLFDHQLVLCKRDILNRNRFTYAGRVYIDQILLEDMEDGKDNTWGINVKNAFQLHNKIGDKWHIIAVKSKDEKEKWIKAFNDERKLVREDRKNDFVIPGHVKKEAAEKALKEQQQQQQTVKKPKNVKRKISHMPFPRQLELLQQPQKSVTLPQGISSEEAFLAMGDEHYKKRTWNIFGTMKRKR